MKKILTWFGGTFGNTWVADGVKNLMSSLNNTKLGYSSKKITALVLLYSVVKMHFAYCDFAFVNKDFGLFPTILTIDVSTILALYGINEYGKSKTKDIIPPTTEQTTVV